MRMLKCMSGNTPRDRVRIKCTCKKLGVVPVEDMELVSIVQWRPVH